MENLFESGIIDLLHIDDGLVNKLLDLYAGKASETYLLYNNNSNYPSLATHIVDIIKNRIGKTANTVLRKSAINQDDEQLIIDSSNSNVFDWCDAQFKLTDSTQLNSFITEAYKNITYKGYNPMFLSVGALKWRIVVGKETDKEIIKEVFTPLILFPIELVRGSSSTAPVVIKFIADDVNLNPVLYYRLKADLNEDIANNFPHPDRRVNQSYLDVPFDKPIDIDKFDRVQVTNYLANVKKYVENFAKNGAVFEFCSDIVAMFKFNHNQLCMYYDLKRHEDEILNHPLVQKMMYSSKDSSKAENVELKDSVRNILDVDSNQQNIIEHAVNGESMVIKGPPGSGKTLTIANIAASLIANNKKVLISSSKLAALSEVYSKMPENLRKFLLLLDSESETQASKLDVSEIRKEMNEIINAKKAFKSDKNLSSNRYALLEQRKKISDKIGDYIKTMYEDCDLLNENYYDSLDKFYENTELPVVNFLKNGEIHNVNREEYLSSKYLVEKLGNDLDKMTNNRTHPANLCPWFGVNIKRDWQILSKEHEQICYLVNEFKNKIDKLGLSKFIKNLVDNLSFDDLNTLAYSQLQQDVLYSIFVKTNEKNVGQIEDLLNILNHYSSVNEYLNYSVPSNSLESDLEKLKNLKFDDNFTLFDLNQINETKELCIAINSLGNGFEKLKLVAKLKDYYDILKLLENKQLFCDRYFKQFLSDDDLELISDGYNQISKYSNKNKVKFIDLKSKKHIRKIRELLKDNNEARNVSLSDLIIVSKEYKDVRELRKQSLLINQEIADKIGNFDKNKMRILLSYFEIFGFTAESLEKFTYCQNQIERYNEIVDNKFLNESFKIVKEIYECHYAIKQLKNTINDISSHAIMNPNEVQSEAKRVVLLYNLKKQFNLSASSIDSVCNLINVLFTNYEYLKINSTLDSLKHCQDSIRKQKVNNFYGNVDIENVPIRIFEILSNEYNDVNVIDAARNYYEELNSYNGKIPINDFFAYFETNQLQPNVSFVDVYEHSVYGSIVNYYKTKLETNINLSVANYLNGLFSQYAIIESQLQKCNDKLIEENLLSNINADDLDYAFLKHQTSRENIRQFFNKYAIALLKLKKCLIVSPSTASLLFTKNDLYNSFDVVIVDEASQLRPVEILPILFRSKQCIVVGDEFQMPYIEHFKIKRKENGEDEDLEISPEPSALSQMLKNNYFKTYELICHFRSQTETLIKFSQANFYPNLKTFPAPIPKKPDLGFKDVYIENGFSFNGKNEAEAKSVVKSIEDHFAKYFRDNKLSESLGVVTFGVAQKQLILDLINKNYDLSRSINKAIQNRNSDDVPEKVIFFKTIEQVQGIECDHLILSLTYGYSYDQSVPGCRRKNLNFGQLNRSLLGKCIFNVAVTRAKKSITVIHSIKSFEITDDTNIGYIKDYLSIVETFSSEDEQFVSEPPTNLEKSVGTFIESLGFNGRVVYNYGITDGSIRIPIAILSTDLKKAIGGIFIESDLASKFNYLDLNVHYFNILTNRVGWKLYRLYASDWFRNSETIEAEINKFLNNLSDD